MNELLLSIVPPQEDGNKGQLEWYKPGTYTWTVPEGVTMVHAAVVGGGQSGNSGLGAQNTRGGAGGAIRWRNNIPVTPGDQVTIVVGSGGTARSGTYNDVLTADGGGNSTVFDLSAGMYATGSPITTTIKGFDGGYNGWIEGTIGKFVSGASAATFTGIGTESGQGKPTNGVYLNGKTPDGSGRGFGGYAVSPSQANGSSAKSVGAGGAGAVRIMWGGSRTYPNKVSDVVNTPAILPANLGPGPTSLIAGNADAGYFGVVDAASFISYTTLMTAHVPSQGSAAPYTSYGWWKFILDGKILFIAQQAAWKDAPWQAYNTLGLTAGKGITVAANSYIHRLIHLDVIDPTNIPTGQVVSPTAYPGLKNSEWGRLILNVIHPDAGGTGLWANWTKSQLNWTAIDAVGMMSVVKERRSGSTTQWLSIGGFNGATFVYQATANSAGWHGHRPVLELVQ